MKRLLVIDIDGTLADDRWRNGPSTASYDERQKQAAQDHAILDMVEFVAAMAKAKWFVVGLTSRNERWRQLTQRWLLLNNVHLDELWMRDDNDFSSADEYKVRTVKDIRIIMKPTVMLLVDSRDDVAMAYKNEGWVTLCTHL